MTLTRLFYGKCLLGAWGGPSTFFFAQRRGLHKSGEPPADVSHTGPQRGERKMRRLTVLLIVSLLLPAILIVAPAAGARAAPATGHTSARGSYDPIIGNWYRGAKWFRVRGPFNGVYRAAWSNGSGALIHYKIKRAVHQHLLRAGESSEHVPRAERRLQDQGPLRDDRRQLRHQDVHARRVSEVSGTTTRSTAAEPDAAAGQAPRPLAARARSSSSSVGMPALPGRVSFSPAAHAATSKHSAGARPSATAQA